MRVKCSAMLRIKNEERWIGRVLASIAPICHRIFVLDDRSTDNTAEICREFPNTVVFGSPFETLDESRDKNWLYDRVLEYSDYCGSQWPEWLLCIDGDEVLHQEDAPALLAHFASQEMALNLRVIYLWNDESTQRVDGVYANFCRPSAFRIINPVFRFQKTPFGNGANFHCSSIPQELLYKSVGTDVRLLHYGYMDQADRIRKWHWYNSIDPVNVGEGFDHRRPERGSYPHIVQGDIPEVPARVTLKHAGPLELRQL